MLRKLSVFLFVVSVFSILGLGSVVADDVILDNESQLDDGYTPIHDKKFDINLDKWNEHTYQLKVSRKDHDFFHYKTYIYIKLKYVDVDQNVRYVDQLLPLEKEQHDVSKLLNFDVLEGSSVLMTDYGIRFPADNPSLSFDDAVFNLELQYWDPFIGDPYIKYWFYRKDGKNTDAHVTLKRNIRLKFANQMGSDYAGVGLEPHESRKEGTLHYDDEFKKLRGFTTTPRDYYFQFS